MSSSVNYSLAIIFGLILLVFLKQKSDERIRAVRAESGKLLMKELAAMELQRAAKENSTTKPAVAPPATNVTAAAAKTDGFAGRF